MIRAASSSSCAAASAGVVPQDVLARRRTAGPRTARASRCRRARRGGSRARRRGRSANRSPRQTSRLGLRQERSTLAHSASSHRMRPARSRSGCVGRVVAERARQQVDAEVEAQAGVEQVLHLLVGLVAPDLRRQVDGHQVRDRYVDEPGDPGDDDLGHQHPQPLAGAAELADVDAQVVGLDDPGQRAALAQRRHVAGRAHLPQRCPCVAAPPRAVPAARRRRSPASGHSSFIPRSASSSSCPTAQLRYHLWSLGTTYQGAASVLQRSSAIS